MNVRAQDPPALAVFCWEAGQAPRGLVQLEALPGNSTNPATYPFPVRFCRIEGANLDTVLENPSQLVLRRMIEQGHRLAAEGIRAITTSCGFNAVFQQDLAEALDIPVFTSSLLQVPLVSRLIPSGKKIGIVTAKKAALRAEHLRAVGISEEMAVAVFGLEECREWNKIFRAPDDDMDLDAVAGEVVETATRAARTHPEIAAIVLECTDLPPFAPSIRKATGLPVYDYTTLVRFVAASLGLVPTF